MGRYLYLEVEYDYSIVVLLNTKLWTTKIKRYNRLLQQVWPKSRIEAILVTNNRTIYIVLRAALCGVPDMTRMKALACTVMWWTKIDEDIEEIMKGCTKYQTSSFYCGLLHKP